MTRFGSPPYGLSRTFAHLSYDRAVASIREALAAEGFGILTEIDVQATLKKKLDVDGPPYVILGACNPQLAHRALTADPAIGLLLPCNVVVMGEGDGATVSIADPRAMFQVVSQPALDPVVEEARTRLQRALAAIPAAG